MWAPLGCSRRRGFVLSHDVCSQCLRWSRREHPSARETTPNGPVPGDEYAPCILHTVRELSVIGELASGLATYQSMVDGPLACHRARCRPGSRPPSCVAPTLVPVLGDLGSDARPALFASSEIQRRRGEDWGCRSKPYPDAWLSSRISLVSSTESWSCRNSESVMISRRCAEARTRSQRHHQSSQNPIRSGSTIRKVIRDYPLTSIPRISATSEWYSRAPGRQRGPGMSSTAARRRGVR